MNVISKSGIRATWALALGTAVLVSACGTIDTTRMDGLSTSDSVAVLPMGNYTETPDAGQAAQSMSANALRQLGMTNVMRAPGDPNGNAMFGTAQSDDYSKSLAWARSQHARYALTGTVNEWRYKVGVDGEPAVGVTFELIDVDSGKVLWSATGARTGWSRSGLASTAQTLIGKLLSPLSVRS